MPNQHTKNPASPPVVIGQTRADTTGGTIIIGGLTPAQRFVVKYPQDNDHVAILSAATIMECYPIVVSEPR